MGFVLPISNRGSYCYPHTFSVWHGPSSSTILKRHTSKTWDSEMWWAWSGHFLANSCLTPMMKWFSQSARCLSGWSNKLEYCNFQMSKNWALFWIKFEGADFVLHSIDCSGCNVCDGVSHWWSTYTWSSKLRWILTYNPELCRVLAMAVFDKLCKQETFCDHCNY